MLLVGTIAPLTLNYVHKSNRWERLAAFPGLWIGLTVIVASLHGVRHPSTNHEGSVVLTRFR